MPRKPGKVPSYCRHKHSGQAVVRIDGRDRYLGRYGTPDSHETYERLVAEWRADHTQLPARHDDPGNGHGGGRTVNELILAFWNYARAYYVKDGHPTEEQAGIRCALRFVRRLYGNTPARDFGPLGLKAVREAMIEADISRGVINQYVNRIRRMFRWAVENELVSIDVYQALTAVSGLRRNRSTAREKDPVTPVPEAHYQAALPRLPKIVQAIVQFQRLTGCRPQEACLVRPCDVDRSAEVWCYQPATHKMEHQNRRRRVFIGPKAQEILRPYLDRPTEAYCFSPRESRAAAIARSRRAGKATKKPTGNSHPLPPNRAPGDHYKRHSYRQAVERACLKAGVPAWTPNQLRHSRATEVRGQYGLEASQTLLGHGRADVTQIYAERDEKLAKRIAKETG